MFDHDEELIARVAAELRGPVPADPRLDARILAAVAAAPRPGARLAGVAAAWSWLRRPRTLRVSPLGLLAAAALAAVLLWRPWGAVPAAGTAGLAPVQFVFVEPRASSVSLVGDFNDWNPTATPLAPARAGVWTVTLPLAPGRHRYAFLVDGTRWTADPRAPRAAGDDFGVANSVVTVGGDT